MITQDDMIRQLKKLNTLNDQYDDLPFDETFEEKEDELLIQINEETTKLVDMIYSFMGGKLDKQMIEKIIRFYPDRVLYILTKGKV